MPNGGSDESYKNYGVYNEILAFLLEYLQFARVNSLQKLNYNRLFCKQIKLKYDLNLLKVVYSVLVRIVDVNIDRLRVGS